MDMILDLSERHCAWIRDFMTGLIKTSTDHLSVLKVSHTAWVIVLQIASVKRAKASSHMPFRLLILIHKFIGLFLASLRLTFLKIFRVTASEPKRSILPNSAILGFDLWSLNFVSMLLSSSWNLHRKCKRILTKVFKVKRRTDGRTDGRTENVMLIKLSHFSIYYWSRVRVEVKHKSQKCFRQTDTK